MQKTQGFGKYSIFVFLNPPKIDSKTAEILVKCRICIRKCKIDLKRAWSIRKLVEFSKNWMEYSEKLRNSSEKFKTQAKNSKTQAKNSRIRQIHLVYLPKTRPKKAALGAIMQLLHWLDDCCQARSRFLSRWLEICQEYNFWWEKFWSKINVLSICMPSQFNRIGC